MAVCERYFVNVMQWNVMYVAHYRIIISMNVYNKKMFAYFFENPVSASAKFWKN